jgi:DNA-binding MarR family transcriptional regulator
MDKQELIQSIFQNMSALGRNLAGRNLGPYSKGSPTYAQIGVLFTVSKNSQQTIKDVAACFGMTSSAATQLVNGLEKEGMLTRKEDKVDRRKTCLELTPKGRKYVANIKKKRYKMMAEILETLNSEELLQLKRIQDKITEHLKLIWIKNPAK